MTTYTLICATCRQTAAYTEKPGHDLYESSDLEGWTWNMKVGNVCPRCNLARVSHPVRIQPAPQFDEVRRLTAIWLEERKAGRLMRVETDG